MSSSVSDLSSCTKNPSTTTDDVISSLDGVAQKICTLKRKVDMHKVRVSCGISYSLYKYNLSSIKLIKLFDINPWSIDVDNDHEKLE